MNNLLVSVGVRYDVVAIVLMQNGCVVHKHIERVKDSEITKTNFKLVIQSFIIALRVLRRYMNENPSCCKEVCFEMTNATFVKWVDNRYSKEAYEGMFQYSLSLLQEIPVRYLFSCVPKTRALPYANEKYLVSNSITGLNLDTEE